MAPPPDLHSAPGAGVGVLRLPLDALYEILLHLPARDLCRFRAVSRAWRSLLSGLHFIAAHAARHPGPLVVTGYDLARYHLDYSNRGVLCDIMDISGNVVKRVGMTQEGKLEGEWVKSIQLDLICRGRGLIASYQLLNPATGAIYALPKGFAKGHAFQEHRHWQTFIAFGKVALTGEYKVLRVLDNSSNYNNSQLYEVFTLDGNNTSRWRGKKGPSDIVQLDLGKSVVVGGIVYFLSYVPERVTSFDLETEDWKEALRGPLSGLMDNNFYWTAFSMATLSGCLVVVHHKYASVDLWFLVDSEKGLWVKQHSIPTSVPCATYKVVVPLLVLDDGRIVLIYLGVKSLIRTYNPRTDTFTDIAEMGYCVAVGLYTGSLLSLPSSAS